MGERERERKRAERGETRQRKKNAAAVEGVVGDGYICRVPVDPDACRKLIKGCATLGKGRKECCTFLTGDFSTRSREDKETFPFTRKIAQTFLRETNAVLLADHCTV